jgi:peptidoglycan L-alanyl-D-glutamate endopeptidase CwlK
MSYQLLKKDVIFYQRFLKANGLYPYKIDGNWGPKTNQADADFIEKSAVIATQYGTYDARSEGNIITLAPKAQVAARQFLKVAKDNNLDIRIISGTRTYAEQNVLYSQGRTKTGSIVTYAKGGQSNHNFGIAWDIGIFNAQQGYIKTDANYVAFGTIVMGLFTNIEWGGNWHPNKDFPHYQLKAVSDSVATIRALFESGIVYV